MHPVILTTRTSLIVERPAFLRSPALPLLSTYLASLAYSHRARPHLDGSLRDLASAQAHTYLVRKVNRSEVPKRAIR